MVTFYNIRLIDGYIYANAWNEMNGVIEDIKAKVDGTYHSSSDHDIIKATWSIVAEYVVNHKLPKKTTVAWG